MLVYPVTSTGPCPRILWTLLLLAASLNVNAHHSSWDSPNCTELVSVPRGNHVVMTCSISNILRDVTIELTAGGKNRTIFNQKPPGNYSNGSWQLRIQGGQAELLIADAQDIHNGSYLWRLRGHQQDYRRITLNVNDLVPANQKPSPAVSIIIIINVLLVIIICALAWYKRFRSVRHHQYEIPVGGLSRRSSGNSAYLILH